MWDGVEHGGVRFVWTKGAGQRRLRNDTDALLKQQNHNFSERFIDSRGSGLLRWFCTFKPAKQLHAWNGKTLLVVSETSSRLKQLRIHRIENERMSAFLAWNAFAEEVEIDLLCIRQIFLERLITSLQMDRYIPSHNYLNTFNWVRSPSGVRATSSLWRGLHCWTVDWAAKSTSVKFDSILNGCPN